MSDAHGARQTSTVRESRRRAEPLQPAAPGVGNPFDPSASRPRTTRFRLERVSLLPFVPAPLVAYVERARVRRRMRLIATALLVTCGAATAAWLLATRRVAVATETPSAPASQAAGHDMAPRVQASRDAAPATALDSPPERGASPKLTAPSPPTAEPGRKPANDAPRSTPQRPSAAPSAWWW